MRRHRTLIIALSLLATPTRCVQGADDPHVVYVYDDLGRLKQVVDQDGRARTYTYDAVGNLLQIDVAAGDCAAGPPVVQTVVAESCLGGTACRVVVEGQSLLGAGVMSSDPQAVVSDCAADCTAIRCTLTAQALRTPRTVDLTIATAQGTTHAAIEVLPSPALDAPGQAEHWHLVANRGDIVTLSMTRIANQPDGSGSLDPLAELHDSRGVLLTADDDSGSASPKGPGKNAVIRSFQLPATDTYDVVARGSGGTFGPYTLEIMPPTARLFPGPPPGGQEAPTFTFTGTIVSAVDRHTHAFAANRGAVVTIEVNRLPSDGDLLDPAMEVRDSRNFLLRADDDGGTNNPPGPGRNAIVKNLTLPATDTYRVVVSGSGATTGPYEVRVFVRN